MNKAYDKVTWQNTPNTATPLNATNLNKMSDALDVIDDRVIALDTNKANTSDVTTALAGKVDKETGKGLSENDYTTAEKTKLAGISAQANKVEITPVVTEGTTLATISIDGVDTDIKGSDIDVDDTPSSTSANPLENKAVYELVQSILPEKTAEGNPISIDDASGLDAKSALVTFAPKQSGTGDPSPSNIRPISGWDGLTLTRTGKNVVKDYSYSSDVVSYSNGIVSVIGTASENIKRPNSAAAVSNNYTTLLKAGTYKPSLEITPPEGIVLNILDSEGNSLSINGATFTLSKDTLVFPRVDASVGTYNYTSGIMIELGSTATDYEPYQGETHTATFPSTIMGGSYDFVSGEGVNPWCAIKVDLGSLNYTYSSSGQGTFRSSDIETVVLKPASNDDKAGIMCECYTVQAANDVYRGVDGIGITSGGKLWIHDTRTTDPDAFKSLVNGLYLIYPLTTPTPITLTPADVNLLKGSNTLWTDGDTVQIKYSVSIESLVPTSTRNLTKSSPITEPQTKETETEITEETEEK